MTMACMTLRVCGNSGGPVSAFPMSFIRKSMPNNDEKEKGKLRSRESDNLIVLMIVGNATGRKEVTHGSA